MWMVFAIILVIIAVIFVFEYRLRKPDQIVLAEARGQVIRRKAKFYPRHFSLAIPGTIYSMVLESDTEAKGKLLVHVKLAAAVAASPEHLLDLIKVGGWNKNAVSNAANELKIMLHTKIKSFCEKYEIEELTSERLAEKLNKDFDKTIPNLGLDIVSLNVQSIDPIDEEISEAMQQQESARIMEQTEELNQKARLASVNARIKADEQIAQSEHRLELKKYDLKKVEQKKEAELAHERVEEELKRRKMQLELDHKEVELLKNNPELLVLTPQVARLAEASQNLKNAKTIVSLSPSDVTQGSQLLGMVQNLLQNMLPKSTTSDGGKKSSKK